MTTMDQQLRLGELDGEAFFFYNYLTSHVRLNEADCTKIHRVAMRPIAWLTINPELLRAIFHQVTGLSPGFMALVEYYTILARRPQSNSSSDEEDASCDVCQVPYSESSESSPAECPIVLGCGHAIGERCLARWLFRFQDMSHTCPVCRQDVWLPMENDFQAGLRSQNLLKMMGVPDEEETMDDEHTHFLRIRLRAIQVLQAIQTRVLRYQAFAENLDEANRMVLMEHTLPAMIMCCKPSKLSPDDPLVLKDAGGKVIFTAEADMRIAWASGSLPRKSTNESRAVSAWQEFRPTVTPTQAPRETIAGIIHRDILPDLHESAENIRQTRQRFADYHIWVANQDFEELQRFDGKVTQLEERLDLFDASISYLGTCHDRVIRAIRPYDQCNSQGSAALRQFWDTVLDSYYVFKLEVNHAGEKLEQIMIDYQALNANAHRMQLTLGDRVQDPIESGRSLTDSLQAARDRFVQRRNISKRLMEDAQTVRDWLKEQFLGVTEFIARVDLDLALVRLRQNCAAMRLTSANLPEHVWDETIASVPSR